MLLFRKIWCCSRFNAVIVILKVKKNFLTHTELLVYCTKLRSVQTLITRWTSIILPCQCGELRGRLRNTHAERMWQPWLILVWAIVVEVTGVYGEFKKALISEIRKCITDYLSVSRATLWLKWRLRLDVQRTNVFIILIDAREKYDAFFEFSWLPGKCTA